MELGDASECTDNKTFDVGESILLSTQKDNFTCSVTGKVFRDAEGNFIQETVSGLFASTSLHDHTGGVVRMDRCG